MSSGDANGQAARERCSALVDGELDAAAVTQACKDWRDDAQSRACWHGYQLIGDVLRSEDLASAPASDAAFLARLRERLSTEPVVLAPEPLAAAAAAVRPARNARWSWMAPSAVAAGFVAVAGALLVTRTPVPPLPDAASTAIALEAAPSAPVSVAQREAALVRPAVNLESEPEVLVASGKLIRDARLDRYLAAHKQFAGSSALGVPSTFLRSPAPDEASR